FAAQPDHQDQYQAHGDEQHAERSVGLSGIGFGDIGKRTESDVQQRLSPIKGGDSRSQQKATGSETMGSDIMASYGMKTATPHTKGFTLIASLLLLLLLSGIAIGLMMMVNTEGKVGGTDLQNNAAYHSAEGGIEKMNSDLAATFQNAQSPTAAQICNLSTLQPSMGGVTWKEYQVTPGTLGAACPGSLTALTKWGQIVSGPNQGLWAQII